MADHTDRFCPDCGRMSPPFVQVCLCGHRFPPQVYESPTGYAPYPPPEPDYTNGKEVLAIAGMMFGIVAVAGCFYLPLSVACGVAGVILSALGVNSNRRGMAIAGLVCGLVGVMLAVGIYEWKRLSPYVRVINQFSSGTDRDSSP